MGRGQRAHCLGHVLRRMALDYSSLAAGAGALRLGEVEASRRRAGVRRLLRGRRVRRGHQRGAAHQLGLAVQHRLSGGLRVGAADGRRGAHHQRRRLLPQCRRARSCRSDGSGLRCCFSAAPASTCWRARFAARRWCDEDLCCQCRSQPCHFLPVLHLRPVLPLLPILPLLSALPLLSVLPLL